MANVDNIGEIKRLDKDNILRNIQEFPEQCEQCWQDFKKFALPTSFIQAKNVLLCGMGGSGIGGALVQDLARLSGIPIISWSDYDLPGFVDKETLVIITSYSGNTEETISSYKKAAERTNKIIAITTGGKIGSLSTNYRNPIYKINYGSEPRAALGYSFTAILAIFAKLNIIELKDDDFAESIILLKGLQKKIDISILRASNNAKLLADKLVDKIPILYGSGTLSAVARRWKGNFNENSKSASYFEIIPELNHNSLVGLEFPKDLKSKLFVIILQSKFDHPRNRLRQNITAQILQKNRIDYDYLLLEPSPTPLSEILQVIHFGDYVSFYLAMLNNTPPDPVSIIEFLKDKLAEKPFDIDEH